MELKTSSQRATERFLEGIRWFFAGSVLAFTVIAAWALGTAIAAIGRWLLAM